MDKYLPEGLLFEKDRLGVKMQDEKFIIQAYRDGRCLEARAVMCDSGHNLHFRFGAVRGFMPYEECAEGIREGTQKDIAIISRVNKLTGFYITDLVTEETGEITAILSRTKRQKECRENYISQLVPGDIIDARITHLEPFGAFCDIGAGINALLPIDSISVSRIPDPSARFKTGDDIKCAVRCIDADGRITLSHKELLGSWEENAALFSEGETVTGIIRSVESYGVFVELMPNLAGLAEYVPEASAGRSASVFIKSINPSKMKIKLIIVDTDEHIFRKKTKYFVSCGHLDFWQYSPENSSRKIYTDFTVSPF
ncbi:MAG: 30S ribosomal protein S1 [Ruminococcaceae bacterium]|nr:30S ribosomal protein S1 [Oscillospiraceae bacterium]